MKDILARAWNVLEPDERPGINVHVGTGVEFDVAEPEAAYDRLCQAVEGVLYDLGLRPAKIHGQYLWGRDGHGGYDDGWLESEDRLTAAVLALESERGSDA